jgi:two-component system, chemotaxis family, chemotaxis protein CheY
MGNRLLVIDDDNVHRSLICRLGEKAGFETIGVESFNEAAKLLRDTDIDCITLDLSLGDRSGGETVGLLSMLKCECPIIIISGAESCVFSEVVDLARTLELDLRAAICKPIDLMALRLTLSEICKQVDIQELASEAREGSI